MDKFVKCRYLANFKRFLVKFVSETRGRGSGLDPLLTLTCNYSFRATQQAHKYTVLFVVLLHCDFNWISYIFTDTFGSSRYRCTAFNRYILIVLLLTAAVAVWGLL